MKNEELLRMIANYNRLWLADFGTPDSRAGESRTVSAVGTGAGDHHGDELYLTAQKSIL